MFENYGYCYCCDAAVKFVAKNDWWRDHYLCAQCGCIPRERATMYCIEKFFPEWRNTVLHESSPTLRRGPSVRFQNEVRQYIPTYYFPDTSPGKTRQGYRCENLERLTFADNSIDLHITQDVCEHILDPATAFREIARTLKPGGAHVFTVPLVNKNAPTRVCATRNQDGSIAHLVDAPEYHGDPLSTEGTLVTVKWGYDITRHIFEACGLFTEMVWIDALELGIRAECIEVLITRKH